MQTPRIGIETIEDKKGISDINPENFCNHELFVAISSELDKLFAIAGLDESRESYEMESGDCSVKISKKDNSAEYTVLSIGKTFGISIISDVRPGDRDLVRYFIGDSIPMVEKKWNMMKTNRDYNYKPNITVHDFVSGRGNCTITCNIHENRIAESLVSQKLLLEMQSLIDEMEKVISSSKGVVVSSSDAVKIRALEIIGETGKCGSEHS